MAGEAAHSLEEPPAARLARNAPRTSLGPLQVVRLDADDPRAATKQIAFTIAVIALGANDGLRGQSVDALRNNLDATIAQAKQAGVKVLLAGMKVPRNYGAEYAQAFEVCEYGRQPSKEELRKLFPFFP